MKNHYCTDPSCLAKTENLGHLCDECKEEKAYQEMMDDFKKIIIMSGQKTIN